MFFGKTMRSRLFILNIIISFLLVGLVVTIFYVTTRNQMIDEKTAIVSLEVEQTTTFIEREFSKLYEVAQALQLTVKDKLEISPNDDYRLYLIAHAETLIENNDNILGVNFVFEPDVVGKDADHVGDDRFQFDGQFITYVSKQNNVASAVYLDQYETYEFYTRAVAEKTDFFTEPYYFNVQGEETFVSTVVFPIVENGEFLGLVGIDFTAEYIFEKLEVLNPDFERRDIIVSHDGVILLDTTNVSNFGKHISTIHPTYYISLSEVDINGERIGSMEGTDNLEIIQGIELGSSGDTWYIFSDVDRALLLAETNQIAMISTLVGISVLIVYLGVMLISINTITKPINKLSSVISDHDIEHINQQDLEFNTYRLSDLSLLVERLKESVRKVQENLLETKQRQLLTTNQISLRQEIDVTSSMKDMCRTIVESLMSHSNSIVGSIYVYTNEAFHLISSIGTDADITRTFDMGQGVIGQVAQSKEPLVLSHKALSPVINTGVASVEPPHLLAYPVVNADKTIAVYQLISLEPFTDDAMQYIDMSTFTVGNAIIRQLSVEQTELLYKKAKNLADELEVQQEELRVKNEELESQQEELRVTNEELETQQEELRVTNKELQFNLGQIEKMNQELEETKEQLEQRTDEAVTSNQYKSDFLASMSHELRTPLNSILILSELIKDQKGDNQKLTQHAEAIHTAGVELLDLIDGILDLSKIEAGAIDLDIEECKLSSDFTDLLDRFDILCKDKNIAFKSSIPTKDITFQTDIQKLRIILQNFLSNAVKFTQEGSVSLVITEHDNELQFDVIDTGIGIKEEVIEHIFDAFKQADQSTKRSYGGTGLGLAICDQYAKHLNGRIDVTSVVNQGSTFSLFIPKVYQEPVTPDIVVTPKRTLKSRPVDEGVIADDRHNITSLDRIILIIDNDKDNLLIMRDFYREQKIKVIVSDSGENGMYLADYYRPNMIVLEQQLPNASGKEVIEKLTNNDRTKSIPVILISKSKIGKDLSTFPHYKKPLSKDNLFSLIDHMKSRTQDKHHILFVEDDELHLRSMVEYISAHKDMNNLLIDTASTKAETLKKITHHAYDVLVVDLNLPDAKGFELVESIREIKKLNEVPIIVYTGKRFTSEEEADLQQMVQDIIIKANRSPERLLQDIQLFLQSYASNQLKSDKTIFTNKHVLIVDDDIRNIFALTGLLETYNINVLFDTSGKDAIKRLKDNAEVDLILMDIMMPEMDGYETTRAIRKMKEFESIPIIALTAKTMRGDREKCIAAGATEYLSKPLNKDKLFSVLRIWLQ